MEGDGVGTSLGVCEHPNESAQHLA
jgi:hypothetical protein